MREIKFKVWIPYRNTMMHPIDIQTIYETTLSGVTIGQLKSWVYLQFTGVKDQKEVDIYDGDIVKRVYTKFEIGNYQVEYYAERVFEVRWNGWCFGLFEYAIDISDSVLITWLDHINGKRIEVIGNVYQNPELLKKEVQL